LQERFRTLKENKLKPAPIKVIEGFNICADLSENQTEDLLKVLHSFPNIWAEKMSDLRVSKLPPMKINLKHGTKPVRVPPRVYSPNTQAEIDKVVHELYINNKIKISKGSPWASACVRVIKPNGGIRLTHDYRPLNLCTIHDSYPMEKTSQIFSRLGGSVHFSSFDNFSGFFSVKLAKESQPLTAFHTSGKNGNLWEFLVMPQGLKGSPAHYQRCIDLVLAGLRYRCAIGYIDDIIGFSPSFEQHLIDIRDICSAFQKWDVQFNKKKCFFCFPRLRYLGHVISKDGLHPDLSKVESIVNYPRPTDVQSVHSFTAFCQYYSQYIPDLSTVAEYLLRFLRKDTKFVWDKYAEKSFLVLKWRLLSTPVLRHPNWDLMFILQTDASKIGLSAILSQAYDHPDRPGKKVDHVIAYASRLTKKSERNYSAQDLEASAVVFGTRRFREYLIDKPFQIVTDHRNLAWILRQTEGRRGRHASEHTNLLSNIARAQNRKTLMC